MQEAMGVSDFERQVSISRIRQSRVESTADTV